VALVAALGGAAYIVAPASSESTDDAYLAADATAVAPKVRGLVQAVLVHDNQRVRVGDPLVQIDPEEFDARVHSAKAELADALADVAAAKARLLSLAAEERLAEANVDAARSVIRSSAAQAERADADRRRFEALVSSGAIAAREADTYRVAAVTAEQEAVRSNALLDVARQQASVTAAKRATLLAEEAKAEATAQRASASLDLAQQDQRHTLITAPIDGVIGNRQVHPGDYVQPGSRLLTLVRLDAMYVTANFKETQTGRMRPGQRASIRADALPGQRLTGEVESFAPGSGSEFSLLPFEPGTGNFTKIVQRVPVRIHLDPGQAAVASLRPGLSVTARVQLQ
jgi:membrane fusion protein (multidrug efflux system)